MAQKKEGNPIVGLLVLIVFGFLAYSCVSGGKESPEDRAARIAKEAMDQKMGFHCLSAWDGSLPEFKRKVKSLMRDPDSFEHIETRVTPVDASGEHMVFMKYRARNGFGGVNVSTAIGTFKNSDCSSTIISVE